MKPCGRISRPGTSQVVPSKDVVTQAVIRYIEHVTKGSADDVMALVCGPFDNESNVENARNAYS
jgi:hypothetical protein